jgi:hypothetical protein
MHIAVRAIQISIRLVRKKRFLHLSVFCLGTERATYPEAAR